MMRFLSSSTGLLSLLVLSLAVVGCGDDDDAHGDEHGNNGGEHSLEEEGCEHLQEGPFQSVTATADGAGADITIEHTSVDITLTADARTVTFNAEEDAEFVFFLSENVPMTVIHTADGGEVAAEEEEIGSEICSEIAVQRHYDLEVGQYTIAFGGTATMVSVVHEEAGGHAHEEGEEHDHE